MYVSFDCWNSGMKDSYASSFWHCCYMHEFKPLFFIGGYNCQTFFCRWNLIMVEVTYVVVNFG